VHELAITEGVVDTVIARLGARRVVRVRLRVGRLSAVVPDALRFCFDECARGTTLEGAALEIVEVPIRIRCRSCRREVELDGALPLCPCGSADVDVLGGAELLIHEVEAI
jgi:hydrogenase nickel incorporation protein HypA/HybF